MTDTPSTQAHIRPPPGGAADPSCSKDRTVPTTILDRIRAALKRPSPTTTQLADALVDARRADTEARAAVERQVKVVAAGFLESDATRAEARSRLADLRAGAEDAAAILAEVERRHATAEAADEQARRQGLYDAAKAEADAAAIALSRTYPKLAAGMVAMLKDLAKAQQAVAMVNGQLPDGAEPILDPEMAARGTPGLPREVVSDEWIEAWGRYDQDEPMAEHYQDEITSVGNGWGKRYIPEASRGSLSTNEPQAAYRRRRFHKITYREPLDGDWPLPIAAALQLPAVRGSGMLWGEEHPAFNPGLAAAVMGMAEPDAVLSRLAELDAAATARPKKIERRLKVEWVSHIDVVPLPKPEPQGTTKAKSSDRGSLFGASPFARPGARAGGRR